MAMRLAVIATGLVLAAALAPASVYAAEPPKPSARQIELARDILRATGAEETYDASLRNMFRPMFRETAGMTGSPAAAARAQAFTDGITEAVVRMKPRILDLSATVYAQTFSEQELAEMLAFYKTPLGQAMARKTPELAKNIGEAVAREMPRLMQEMAAELCATSDCPSGMRAMAGPKP